MDLPQVGSHCALPSCNVLDFLPITCQCKKKYCFEHISSERHDCSSMNVQHDMSTFADKILRCFVQGCNKPSLRIYNGGADETCSFCHKSLCPDHRYPDLHDCPSVVGKVSTAAWAPKNGLSPAQYSSPTSSTTPSQKKISDPVKLAQWKKVQAMKMRHRAIPADPKDRNASVPMDERLHIRLTQNDTEKIFWFRKTIVAGRALDLLADHTGLTFSNNTPLQLDKLPSDGGALITLCNSQLLSKQVEEGGTVLISQKNNRSEMIPKPIMINPR